MAAKEYLMTLFETGTPNGGERAIWLTAYNPIEHGADGETIYLDSLDPRSFGRSFLVEMGPDLVWTARTDVKNLDHVLDINGIHCGAIISPRAKAIIEAENIPNIEFIPLTVLYKESDKVLGTWWFVNVFNWRKIFDFEDSHVKDVEFYQPIKGLSTISRRFGERVIADWTELKVHRDALEDALKDGLFLAEGPGEPIWRNIFISKWLLDKINDGLPNDRKIIFKHFLMDHPSIFGVRTDGYSYLGWEK